jgi:esterase/lipase superfamily enzyme
MDRLTERGTSTAISSSDRITIYTSEHDRALGLSATIRGQDSRLGTKPTILPNIDFVDATRAKWSLLNHSVFAEDQRLLRDLALLLRERLPPDRRSIALELSGAIWVLRP